MGVAVQVRQEQEEMDIESIRSEQNHEDTLARVNELMDGKIGTTGAEEFDILFDLIELNE